MEAGASSIEVPTVGTLYANVSPRDGVIATGIWESAQVLSEIMALDRGCRKLLLNKRVLEVGAGTGVVGIACARLGASRVVVTDMDDMHILSTLSRNIALNDENERCVGMPLDWFSHDLDGDLGRIEQELGGVPELVVATDVVYKEEHMVGLIKCLNTICARAPRCVLLTANMNRIETATEMYLDGLRDTFRCKKVNHRFGKDFFVNIFRFKRERERRTPAKEDKRGEEQPPRPVAMVEGAQEEQIK